MKLLLSFTALIFVGSLAVAADAPTGASDPKAAEMMKKWQEFSTPGAEHKKLGELAGKWTYTSKWWQSATAQPEESKGTSTFKMVLGGRFLAHESKGKAMGMPFEGLGYTGYNNLTKNYDTIWLDSMSTGVMHGTGAMDAATNTLKDSGEMACPMTTAANHMRKYRNEWKIIDKNNTVLSMYMAGTDGGAEFKSGELTFKRVGK